jgi:hypothetical protein
LRHQYFHLDPELLRQILAGIDLMRIFNQLLLAAGGDPEEAMNWMRYLQEQGYLDPGLDLEAFFQELEDQRLVERDSEGSLSLTGSGERQIRRSALETIFSGLRKGDAGYHAARSAGEGTGSTASGRSPMRSSAPRASSSWPRRTWRSTRPST